SVSELSRAIIARHGIEARDIVAHSDIAPNRKRDPGELFDWQWLARQGVGIWTEEFGVPGDLLADLAAIGYDIGLPERDVILAFQRHFLPQHLTGELDNLTACRAAAVRRLVDAPVNRS
ncbi:MAG: N-acetylmuramoyl-L-alanine amidase, partial [Rhodospirillales bacterium]|nr:N-acetylmuramoyl-L-alanine amidase [Rhodospirillales bacterium]